MPNTDPAATTTTNFSELVRSLPFDMPVDQVLAKAKEAGIKVKDPKRVYKIRWMAKSAGKAAKKVAKKGVKTAGAVKTGAKLTTASSKKSATKGVKKGAKKTATKAVVSDVATAAPLADRTAAPKKKRAKRARTSTSVKPGPKPSTAKRSASVSVTAPVGAIAAFRQAVLEIGLAAASELIAKYKADNAIV